MSELCGWQGGQGMGSHLAGKRIAILAGHVGRNVGATVPYDNEAGYKTENEINESVARKTVDCLAAAGAEAFYVDGSWAHRAAICETLQPHAAIEIHCDAAADQRANGYTIWYWKCPAIDTESYALGRFLHYGLAKIPRPKHGAEPVRSMELEDNPRHALFENVPVRPLVLLECGFLTNPAECAWLCMPENHEKIASALVKGLDAFFAGWSAAPGAGTESGGVV